MSIVYEGFGNVLTHKSQTVICPVNTVAVMGKGLALAMRNRIRGLYDYHKKLCYANQLYVGCTAIYDIPAKKEADFPKKVLLFPTKEHWKDPSQVEWIEKGLQHLVENYQDFGIKDLAMVPLGCGLGALDYTQQVRPMLYSYLEPIDLDVYLLHRDDSN